MGTLVEHANDRRRCDEQPNKAVSWLDRRPPAKGADIVRVIAEDAYRDFIKVWGIRALLQRQPDIQITEEVFGPAASAAHVVRSALNDWIVIVYHRALAPIREKTDRHMRVAAHLLSNRETFALVAADGDAQLLAMALRTFESCDRDSRTKVIKVYRDKRVAHRAATKPNRVSPLVSDLHRLSSRMERAWAELAVGAGVSVDKDLMNAKPHFESAIAFWKPWNDRIGGF